MKIISRFIITSFTSASICLLVFSIIIFSIFLPEKSNNKTVQKVQSNIAYTPIDTTLNPSLLIVIEECPVLFLVKLLQKNHNLSVSCMPKFSVNDKNQKLKDYKNKETLTHFTKEECNKKIVFNIINFEKIINYLNGLEIETPYGLPLPAKSNTTIDVNERVCAYGASVGALLTQEKQPSNEKMAYYCYIIGELSLKFLSTCDTESYKFLNQNSITDISYTEFYDNYKSLKNNIAYVNCTPPKGEWKDGWFYLE